MKAPDDQVVPLCRKCHSRRHSIGGVKFYKTRTGRSIEDVVELGKFLYSITGKTDRALWEMFGWKA